jgi:hypothetical protein
MSLSVQFLILFIAILGSNLSTCTSDNELPWCTNNSHNSGQWVKQETVAKKSFVCCGGGYAGIYTI